MGLQKFLQALPDGQGHVLNKPAFLKYAREVALKVASKTDEEKAAGLAQFNKLLSSEAGIAQLSAIEGDWEILNILRDSFTTDYAEIRNLPMGTVPIYRTRTLNPVGMFTGSIAGVGGSVYWATSDTVTQVFPFTYSTERVIVPNLNNIYDMERLEQRKEALSRLDLFDREMFENIVLNTAMATSGTDVVNTDPATQIATYAGTGGSFSGHTVYVLDPGVVAASVPTVNFYDLHTEEGLTKRVFRTVNTHSIQIGRAFSTMYIPQAAYAGQAPVWESLQNLATPVALVYGTTSTPAGPTLTNPTSYDPATAVPAQMWAEFQKDDFRGAVIVDWFGMRIAVKKVNWLPAQYALLFADGHPAALVWKRLDLSSGQPQEGTLVEPKDGFYSYVSKSHQIATARPDWSLRNFLVLEIQG